MEDMSSEQYAIVISKYKKENWGGTDVAWNDYDKYISDWHALSTSFLKGIWESED